MRHPRESGDPAFRQTRRKAGLLFVAFGFSITFPHPDVIPAKAGIHFAFDLRVI
jgi:hypothetical protein